MKRKLNEKLNKTIGFGTSFNSYKVLGNSLMSMDTKNETIDSGRKR